MDLWGFPFSLCGLAGIFNNETVYDIDRVGLYKIDQITTDLGVGSGLIFKPDRRTAEKMIHRDPEKVGDPDQGIYADVIVALPA